MKEVMYYLIIFLFLFSEAVNGYEPLTTGAGIFAAGSMLWMVKDKVMCQYRECCEEPWIRYHPQGLLEALDKKLFGQHIAKSVVFRSVQSHMRKLEPKKALVLSFHGMTGSGKNYVSQIIAESLFKEGMKSNYVHVYASKVHFPEKDKVEYYKAKIQSEITEKVKSCPRSLFIFDEIDDLDPGIIDGIKPFLDYYPNIDGVEYRKAIFLFLSNTGAAKIYSTTFQNWRQGKHREELTLDMFDESLNAVAYNEDGGLWRTDIIDKALIDAAVPFLPLEKEHIKLCLEEEINKQNSLAEEEDLPPKMYTDKDLSSLAERRSYDKEGIFSKMGCKKLESLVAMFMEEE